MVLKRERIPTIRKTTHKIDIFFGKKATFSKELQNAADFGLQDKASTASEACSKSEITPQSAKPLDLSQPARLNSISHLLRFQDLIS